MIFCTLCQFLWSLASDSGNNPPEIVRKHIVRCGRCSAAVESMRSLECSLRKTRGEPREEWLQSVMSELSRIPPPVKVRPAAAHPHPVRLVLAGAVALLALIFILRTGLFKGQSAVDLEVAADDGRVVPLTELAMSLENESAALENDIREAARIATYCLPF